MKNIVTGIQSSGKIHLGNLYGAIMPMVELTTNNDVNGYFFIADLHSLTTVKSKELLVSNKYNIAASILACGYDHTKNYLYLQSDVAQTTELMWYLSNFVSYSTLSKSHAFKDKRDNLSNVSLGLFTYPVLMASDILLNLADYVPAGADQKQHLEIARGIATKFNTEIDGVFKIPEPIISGDVAIVPGIDGRKMSKSYGNTIDIFADEKSLKKSIMNIVTSSTPIESPMDYSSCTVFKLYEMIADDKSTQDMKEKYTRGGYGYGKAKTALYELILDEFKKCREQYSYYMNHKYHLDEILKEHSQIVEASAAKVLKNVRKSFGF